MEMKRQIWSNQISRDASQIVTENIKHSEWERNLSKVVKTRVWYEPKEVGDEKTKAKSNSSLIDELKSLKGKDKRVFRTKFKMNDRLT